MGSRIAIVTMMMTSVLRRVVRYVKLTVVVICGLACVVSKLALVVEVKEVLLVEAVDVVITVVK
jgi:hypothetical protein